MVLAPTGPATGPGRRRTVALILLALTQFMFLLDSTVVNIALPTIQRELDFSESGLAWVVSAYLLVFGSFLLLGGRAADLFGRRRVYLTGLTLFVVASVACGAAQNAGSMIAFRAVQGLGCALASPAALALVVTMFREKDERARALGVWGGVAAAGALLGTTASGLIVEYVSWRWIFFVNVPIGAIPLCAVPLLVAETRRSGSRGFDLPGAVVVTGSLALLVYSLLRTETREWSHPATVLGLAGAAVLAVLFVFIERASARPLVRLDFFRHKRRATGFGTMLMLGTAAIGAFTLFALLLQGVQGYSPVRAGVAYLGFTVGMAPAFAFGPMLIKRYGVRPVLVGGLLIDALGMAWFAMIERTSGYWTWSVYGMLLTGFGLAACFFGVQVAALDAVEERDAGLGAALLNACQQVGASIGVAILMTVTTHRMDALLGDGTARPDALLGGLQAAFWTAAAATVLLAVVSGALVGRLVPADIPADQVELDLSEIDDVASDEPRPVPDVAADGVKPEGRKYP